MTIFLADRSDRRRGHPDGRRADRDALVQATELRKLIDEGKIEDAKTLIGFLLTK